MTNEAFEIEHLKALLASRKEEYAIFGRTGEDAVRDAEIRARIRELEEALPEQET